MEAEVKDYFPWIGTVISLSGATVGYGILREKVSRIERDLDEHKAIAVTFKHFEAVMKPINDTLRELRDDMRDFLRRETRFRHGIENENK